MPANTVVMLMAWVAVDGLFAALFKRRSIRQWHLYELVSCTFNVVLFTAVVVYFPSIAWGWKAVCVVYIWTQLAGIFVASKKEGE